MPEQEPRHVDERSAPVAEKAWGAHVMAAEASGMPTHLKSESFYTKASGDWVGVRAPEGTPETPRVLSGYAGGYEGGY